MASRSVGGESAQTGPTYKFRIVIQFDDYSIEGQPPSYEPRSRVGTAGVKVTQIADRAYHVPQHEWSTIASYALRIFSCPNSTLDVAFRVSKISGACRTMAS